MGKITHFIVAALFFTQLARAQVDVSGDGTHELVFVDQLVTKELHWVALDLSVRPERWYDLGIFGNSSQQVHYGAWTHSLNPSRVLIRTENTALVLESEHGTSSVLSPIPKSTKVLLGKDLNRNNLNDVVLVSKHRKRLWDWRIYHDPLAETSMHKHNRRVVFGKSRFHPFLTTTRGHKQSLAVLRTYSGGRSAVVTRRSMNSTRSRRKRLGKLPPDLPVPVTMRNGSKGDQLAFIDNKNGKAFLVSLRSSEVFTVDFEKEARPIIADLDGDGSDGLTFFSPQQKLLKLHDRVIPLALENPVSVGLTSEKEYIKEFPGADLTQVADTPVPGNTPVAFVTMIPPTPDSTATKKTDVLSTSTPTVNPTSTVDIQMTATPSVVHTATHTRTPIATSTHTRTPTFSVTPTPSHTPTVTSTPTPTLTHTFTHTPTVTLTPTITPTIVPVSAYDIRINAGSYSDITTVDGRLWNADTHYTNGGRYAQPSLSISGTTLDEIYRTERFHDNLEYSIPLSNGTYQLILHFAEIFSGANSPGKRVFDLYVEENKVETDLDLFVEAGMASAYTRVITQEITDNELRLYFDASVDKGKLSAIEIKPLSPPAATPTPWAHPTPNGAIDIRVNCGPANVVDGFGNTWISDSNYSSSNKWFTLADGLVDHNNGIDLFDSETFGDKLWEVPLSNGTYWVTMYFAEIYWDNVGERVFRVQAEGTTLISSFDILSSIPKFHVLTKTFEVTVADGELSLSMDNDFSGAVDQAKMSAFRIRSYNPY